MRLILTRRREGDTDWVLSGPETPQQEIDLREGDSCMLRLEMDSTELGLPQDAGGIRLMLSGAAVDRSRYEESKGVLRVTWQWRIEFYAGEISLDVVSRTTTIWSGTLDVSPHTGKLGREAYEELLSDLQARAENVIFGAAPSQRTVTQTDASIPPIARLAMLQAYIRQLERTFAAIALSPNRRLMAEREDRPLDRARRIDTRAFRGIIRSPAALASLGLIDAPGDGLLARSHVDHPRREHTFNTPPNRHVAAMIRRMQLCCTDLERAFQDLAEASEGHPEMQARALAFAAEAGALSRRVLAMSRADFLADVEPSQGDTAAMIAVAKDPTYSRFDCVARRILWPRVSPGTGLCDKLWLRRTYELYEYWCFFRIAEILAEACGGVEWRSSVVPLQGRLFIELPDGCRIEAQAGKLRLRFTFQQTFRAYSPKCDDGVEPYSISGQRRPDMVLSVDDGNQKAMVILDAKYRCSRDAINEALGQMHIYRDSLKVSGNGTKILGAFVVTPAHDAGADVYFTRPYREQYRIGGFDLASGNSDQAVVLCQYLASLLRLRVAKEHE